AVTCVTIVSLSLPKLLPFTRPSCFGSAPASADINSPSANSPARCLRRGASALSARPPRTDKLDPACLEILDVPRRQARAARPRNGANLRIDLGDWAPGKAARDSDLRVDGRR